MPIEELSLEGMDFDEAIWGGEVIRTDFGGGYGAKAIVGGVGGLHRWTLSSGCLPDAEFYGLLIEGVPRMEYYLNFFRRHTTGENDVFIVQFRGQYYHACFSEPEMSFEVFTIDLFAGGVAIRQRRLAGSNYHTDGSLDVNPPTTPTGFTAESQSSTTIRLRWEPSVDTDSDVDGGTSEFDLDGFLDGGDAGG